MPQNSTLTVRQHERATIKLNVEFIVSTAHRAQVNFSRSSGAVDHFCSRGIAVDISSGGLGWLSAQFLPRMCEGMIRVYENVPTSYEDDDTPVYAVAFEHRVKLRRVTMVEDDPTYLIGAAFIDPPPDMDQRVRDLMARLGEVAEEAGEEERPDA